MTMKPSHSTSGRQSGTSCDRRVVVAEEVGIEEAGVEGLELLERLWEFGAAPVCLRRPESARQDDQCRQDETGEFHRHWS